MQTQSAKMMLLLLLLLGTIHRSHAETVAASDYFAGPVEDRSALAAVVEQLCGKETALLGEALHGDGHTIRFKVALVQQLVTKCHYNAVFFEGSYYEFEAIARTRREGKTVTPDMVGAAVGGMWKFHREFQPLLPFLANEVTSGRLALGGIDFQTGGFEQPYTNDVLPAELSNYLNADRRGQCRDAVTRRIYNGFDGSRQVELLRCVTDISHAILSSRDIDPRLREEQNGILANIKAYFETNMSDTGGLYRARDRAMFDNFRALKRRLPPHSKVIVWTATAHLAKDATADPAFATVKNLGSYLHQVYGSRIFTLGFTAQSGSFKWSGQENRALPVAPESSLEAQAFNGSDSETLFLGSTRLQQFGVTQTAVFEHAYRATNLAKALDGIVVFRTEYPPHSIRPGF